MLLDVRMELSRDLELPGTPDAVLRLFLDPGFQEQRCRRGHALRFEVSVEPSGAQTAPAVVTTIRDLPTDRLPDLARNVVGSSLTLEERVEWADPTTGRMTVTVKGAPISLRGAYALGPGGQGTRLAFRGEVKASVPLIGRKLEQMVQPVLDRAMAADEELAFEALQG